METVPSPDTDNVVFIDEYPHLQKKVWLRRLARERVGDLIRLNEVVIFPGGDGA